MGQPLVAIIGRPNVGKSTLFNLLMGKFIAIVDDRPGVTRDRIFGRCEIEERDCLLVDTGGIMSAPGEGIEAAVDRQIRVTLKEATVLVFLVDAQQGLIPDDKFVADVARKHGKPIVLVGNKSDSPEIEARLAEFYALGLGNAIAVSALNRRGIANLREAIGKHLPEAESKKEARTPVRFTVVGRPNVGKSSIVNAIIGEERSIVSDVPGTTRDALNADFVWRDRDFQIVDTAGVRRRPTRMESLEFYGLQRTKKAVEACDVALLTLDATVGLVDGDKKIADLVLSSRRGLVLAVNKIDLIEEPNKELFVEYLAAEAPFLRNTPVVFTSALKGDGMEDILKALTAVQRRMNTSLPIDLLTNVISDIRTMFSPRSKGKRLGEIREVLHDRVNPPRIVIRVNDTDLFPPAYMRLMENRLREVFDLDGVPFELASSSPPKKSKKSSKK